MRLRPLIGPPVRRSAAAPAAPSARVGPGRARTPSVAASHAAVDRPGRSGSMNGNRRHACTSAICVANVASALRGRALREILDERLVALAQRGQVPRLLDHLPRLTQCAQLRPEGQHLRRLLGVHERLAIDMRRDPQPVPERAEPRPRELRRQLMPQLPPLLGHPQHQQQPAPVPAHRPAEPVDPPRPVAQQPGRGRRQPHPRPPAHPLALEPPLARRPHHGLPRRAGREPEPVQRRDQRLLPGPVGTGEQELAEDRQQRRARGRRPDGAAS